MSDSRRKFLKNIPVLGAMLYPSVNTHAADLPDKKKPSTWPLVEDDHTPRMVLGCPIDAGVKTMQSLKQIGIDHVSTVWSARPWNREALQSYVDKFSEQGLKVINIMYVIPSSIVLAHADRDQEIEFFKESIRIAALYKIPTVEYNFYVQRLVEGYHEVKGRGGAGLTAFDNESVKDLPPSPEIGRHTAQALWSNLEYMLKAVVPVAEALGVRLALHPNDPVVQQSHGSPQIVASLQGLKRMIALVDSPSNGITYDSGVFRQMGEDPVEVCRYFARRNRINHVHYRNVISYIPHEKYTEVFLDEGQVNMYAVMQELFRHGYNRALYPEHPFILGYDKDHPGNENITGARPGSGGYAAECFNVGFTRAMMLSVMSSK